MDSISTDHENRSTISSRREYHFTVPPESFTTMKNGRKRNNFKVETIIFKTGCEWPVGRGEKTNYGSVDFDQKY